MSPFNKCFISLKCSESTADCIPKPVRWANKKPKSSSKSAIDAKKKDFRMKFVMKSAQTLMLNFLKFLRKVEI